MESNEIEDRFKKSFENFEADVSPSVWKNIQIALKGFAFGVVIKTLINKVGTKVLAAIFASAVAIGGTVAVVNSTRSAGNKHQPHVKKLVQQKIENKPVAIVLRENEKNIHPKTEATTLLLKDTNPSKPIAIIRSNASSGLAPLIVNLENLGVGKNNNWTFSDGKRGCKKSNTLHIFESPGTHTVYLSSTNNIGQTAIDSLKIDVKGSFPVPIEFSPNGDGVNDDFILNSKNIAKMQAIIYDKDGNVINKWDAIDGKWDGRNLMNKGVADGIYFYIINAEGLNGKKYKQSGSVKLVR